MTSQLYESSEKLRGEQNLHSSNQALEERRRYTEAVCKTSDWRHFHTSTYRIRLSQAATHVKCDLSVINRGRYALSRNSRDLVEIHTLIEGIKCGSATLTLSAPPRSTSTVRDVRRGQ